MRAFAEAYPEEPFVQQVAAQIPWRDSSYCEGITDIRDEYRHSCFNGGVLNLSNLEKPQF